MTDTKNEWALKEILGVLEEVGMDVFAISEHARKRPGRADTLCWSIAIDTKVLK